MDLLRHSLTLGQKSTPLKIKLDSAMTRLHRLCAQDDDDDELWDESGHGQRAKLFEWVSESTMAYRYAHFLLVL